MSLALEAIVTGLSLFGGYLLAAVVVLLVTPKQERLPERIASAAIALTILFALCVVSFIASEVVQDQFPQSQIKEVVPGFFESESGIPLWVDSWNKIAENMVSEVWQIWLAALYFKHRRWPGSPEE
jgi:hypothetical protein